MVRGAGAGAFRARFLRIQRQEHSFHKLSHQGRGAAVLPEGSAVYTNYFALYSSGGFTFTLRGTGLEQLSIALTSDKKANSIDYEIVSSDDGEMVLKFNAAAAKTENVQLKLTNRSGSPVTVTSVKLTRDSVAPLIILPATTAA